MTTWLTLGDEEILWGAVLVHTFALTQSAAEEKLEIDLRSTAGIEDWGGKLLKSDREDVERRQGRQGGAVEVAVVRNAVAHGTRTINPNAAERLRRLDPMATHGRDRGSPSRISTCVATENA